MEHVTDWSGIWHDFDVIYCMQKKKKREYLGFAVEKRENLRALPPDIRAKPNRPNSEVRFGSANETKRESNAKRNETP